MKSLNFLKKAVFTALIVALASGFAACSDNDDNKPKVDPETPTIIMKYPTSIISTTKYSEGKEEPRRYRYEYNDKYQVSKVTVEYCDDDGKLSDDGFKTPFDLVYDGNGKLTSISSRAIGTNAVYESDYGFVYNEAKGIVEVTIEERHIDDGISVDDSFYTYAIDKDGFPQSDKEISPTDYSEFQYDKLMNLTQIYSFVTYDRNDATEIHESTLEFNHDEVYSPYKHINLPAWFFYHEVLDLPFYYMVTGEFFPKSFTNEETSVYKREGKEDEVIIDQTTSTVTIVKEEDNYPTEINVLEVYRRNGEEDGRGSQSFIVEYTTVEVK